MTHNRHQKTTDRFLLYGVLVGLVGVVMILVASPLLTDGIQSALMLTGVMFFGLGSLLSLMGGNIHG